RYYRPTRQVCRQKVGGAMRIPAEPLAIAPAQPHRLSVLQTVRSGAGWQIPGAYSPPVGTSSIPRPADRQDAAPGIRRIAATLRPRTAVAASVLLMAAGSALAASLGWQFSLALAGYFLLTIAYSFILKHMLIVELLALSMGFVLRAAAGALAIAAPVSPWLYL